MSIEKIERLPQRIIGDDAYMQLVFEGYVVVKADELSRLRKIEQRAETVCESHDRASLKELPAGGAYFSIPAKELNDLSRAVTDLRRALSEREGQDG